MVILQKQRGKEKRLHGSIDFYLFYLFFLSVSKLGAQRGLSSLNQLLAGSCRFPQVPGLSDGAADV